MFSLLFALMKKQNSSTWSKKDSSVFHWVFSLLSFSFLVCFYVSSALLCFNFLSFCISLSFSIHQWLEVGQSSQLQVQQHLTVSFSLRRDRKRQTTKVQKLHRSSCVTMCVWVKCEVCVLACGECAEQCVFLWCVVDSSKVVKNFTGASEQEMERKKRREKENKVTEKEEC